MKFPKLRYEDAVVIRPRFAVPKHEIVVVSAGDRGRGVSRETDAISAEACITSTPKLPLFLTIADCSPIILFDPKTITLALVHASRQVTGTHLISRVVEALQQMFHVKPKDLIIGIGPGIKQASYKLEYLGDEFHAPEFASCIAKERDGRYALDIPGINQLLLTAAGVLEKHIEISPIDTATSNDFFSHYRDSREHRGREGFFGTIAMIR